MNNILSQFMLEADICICQWCSNWTVT